MRLNTTLAICLAMVIGSVSAQPHQQDDQVVALVLGGGGAKGVAHIGVLRALEEAEVEIDIITGTSMGAIIGGFYASGLTVDEIEEIIASGTWEKGFTDISSRVTQPMEIKRLDYQELLPYEFGVSPGQIGLPQGLIEGQNILAVFREVIPNYWQFQDFDDMPIPFRAIATNIETGDAVVLGSGDLTLALRASMSLPGIFSPVKIDEMLLIDGGVANNLPIDAAIELGADVVIAVDVGSKAKTEEELTSFLSISSQLVTLMTVKSAEAQKTNLRPQDILVEPDVSDFTTLDFSDLDAISTSGYLAMTDLSERLEALASNDYTRRVALPLSDPLVSSIRFNNRSDVSELFLRSQITQPLGQPLDRIAIEEDIQKLYSRKLFKLLSYNILDNDDGSVTLIIESEQLPRDLSYLQVGMDLSSSIGRGDSNSFNLSLFHRHDMINDWGGGLDTLVRLGDEILLSMAFNQPFGTGSALFIEPYAIYDARDVYDRSEQSDLSEWWLRSYYLGADLGWDITDSIQLRVGLQHYSGSYDSEISVEDIDTQDFNTNGYRIALVSDTLDQFYFPNNGWLARGELTQYLSDWNSDQTFEHYEFEFMNFETVNRHTVGIGLSWESFDHAPSAPPYYTQLGGFMRLSGYSNDELSGSYGGRAIIDYRYRLSGEMQLPMSAALYAGATLEAGNVWQNAKDVEFADLIIAGSLYVAVDSPLGPIYLALGRTETDSTAMYLSFGNP